MQTLRLLSPIACLSVFAFLLLGMDAWADAVTPRLRRLSFWVTLIGLAVSAAALGVPHGTEAIVGRQMMIWDGLSYFFAWIALITVFLVVLISEGYGEFRTQRLGAYYALLLFAAAGLIFLSASNDFLMIFLSIELISVPSFIVAGYLRDKERSNEAALKFFLIGAFSSAMLAYGISIIYGMTGTTSLTQLHDRAGLMQAMGPLGMLAIFFIIVSFGFKIAYVPFHMWVPDVFEGSPKPVAAFLSIGPKMAGAAIALRVFGLVFPQPELGVINIIVAIAALTMTVGNVIGLQQTHIVRLLAYSSIAHMGYLLLGLVGGGEMGFTGMYLYAWVYLFMNLGAFAVVVLLSNTLGSDDVSAYAGLAKRAPVLAGLLALFLLSLAGIPPTAGFIAKFYVFAAAFQAGHIWLVGLATVNSVISVGYYFKVLHWMYFKPPTQDQPIVLNVSERLTLAVASLVTIILGLAPQCFMAGAQYFTVMPKP